LSSGAAHETFFCAPRHLNERSERKCHPEHGSGWSRLSSQMTMKGGMGLQYVPWVEASGVATFEHAVELYERQLHEAKHVKLMVDAVGKQLLQRMDAAGDIIGAAKIRDLVARAESET
jgi:hypothetical protein